jgi:hypothetical protein
MDDAIIMPLVLIVFLATALCQAALFIVIAASEFVFALVLRMLTLPLLVAARTGDGLAWLIKRCAGGPLSSAKRERWHDRLGRRWSALRERMSHEAIGMTVQRALQAAVAWLLQECRALSPRAAVLVIAGVTLWLPLSAAISIAMHAVLLAHADSMPSWMQLLHPVATVIAKSKLLVLPAYPAAWPQAKKHKWAQAALRWLRRIAALETIRKTKHRYQQTKQAFAQAGHVGVRTASKNIRSRQRH